jgi:hypothetical protein
MHILFIYFRAYIFHRINQQLIQDSSISCFQPYDGSEFAKADFRLNQKRAEHDGWIILPEVVFVMQLDGERGTGGLT